MSRWSRTGTRRVTIARGTHVRQPVSPRQVEHDIRRQVGCGIAAGAGKVQILLYAGSEAAAWLLDLVIREGLVPPAASPFSGQAMAALRSLCYVIGSLASSHLPEGSLLYTSELV